jgi:hypothetical protein
MLCPICQEKLVSSVKPLCCNKRMHKACLKRWLATGATTCPMCRGVPRVRKHRVMITKSRVYCTECHDYGHLFVKVPCCRRLVHMPCAHETESCKHCGNGPRYMARADVNNFKSQNYSQRKYYIISGQSIYGYLYNHDVLGTKAIELANALKTLTVPRGGTHNEFKRVMKLASAYALRENIPEIYYQHLKWACVHFGYGHLI